MRRPVHELSLTQSVSSHSHRLSCELCDFSHMQYIFSLLICISSTLQMSLLTSVILVRFQCWPSIPACLLLIPAQCQPIHFNLESTLYPKVKQKAGREEKQITTKNYSTCFFFLPQIDAKQHYENRKCKSLMCPLLNKQQLLKFSLLTRDHSPTHLVFIV